MLSCFSWAVEQGSSLVASALCPISVLWGMYSYSLEWIFLILLQKFHDIFQFFGFQQPPYDTSYFNTYQLYIGRLPST